MVMEEYYSKVGSVISIEYQVSDPRDIPPLFSTFEEFVESVEFIVRTHTPQAVRLSLDRKKRVVIQWIEGGPISGFKSKEAPVFTRWSPRSGIVAGELTGKLPSGKTFIIPL